jgi:polyferredoxin
MLAQSNVLPFDYYFGVPMIFFWIITFLFSIILLDAKLMRRRVTVGIYFITLIIAGIVIGGLPNAINPIQQVLITIAERTDPEYLLPALIILGILLLMSYLVGNVFCGFVCPLGVMQELISKLTFKSESRSQDKAKFLVNISSKNTKRIRWLFLLLILGLAGVWGILVFPTFNPFTGFKFINSLFDETFIIPFLIFSVIGFLSLIVYRPWCRFLCPFGAGSSFLTRFARIKYQRTDNCTDCGLCEDVCPTQEAFEDSSKEECYYCNRCVEICPHDAIIFNLG